MTKNKTVQELHKDVTPEKNVKRKIKEQKEMKEYLYKHFTIEKIVMTKQCNELKNQDLKAEF